MIPLPLVEVEKVAPGRLDAVPWAEYVTGVQIDSRRIEEGDLFVVVGSGADFVRHAFARGAAAVLLPDDAFAALAALGRAVRARTTASVLAVTGSTGKTSTKDILGALCGAHRRTVAAEASFNAELGVPLTLCRLEGDTEICILEFAMRGFGQIAALAAIARPDIGVVTNVAPVHLEQVGTLEGVARAKAELIEALPERGTAVVPSDAPLLDPFLARTRARVIRFGPGGDVELEQLVSGEDTVVTARVLGERVTLRLPLRGRHQGANALAALAGYAALGLPLAEAGRGAADVRLSRWRGEERSLPGDGLLINDAYNANPVSMRAALEHQAERAGGRRRVAILGEMAELGEESLRYHREIGALATELGVAVLVAVGGSSARAYLDGGIANATVVENAIGAIAAARELLLPGDCVLVKGSRSVGLERVAEELTPVAA